MTECAKNSSKLRGRVEVGDLLPSASGMRKWQLIRGFVTSGGHTAKSVFSASWTMGHSISKIKLLS
jgi:hypothetical protein